MDRKVEEAFRTIRESGAQRPYMDPLPPAKWKAWLAPGSILAIVVIVLSFFSSYMGRQKADAENQQEVREMRRQITDLQEQVKWTRENLLSNKQFDEYVRGRTQADNTLNSILMDIRNRQR